MTERRRSRGRLPSTRLGVAFGELNDNESMVHEPLGIPCRERNSASKSARGRSGDAAGKVSHAPELPQEMGQIAAHPHPFPEGEGTDAAKHAALMPASVFITGFGCPRASSRPVCGKSCGWPSLSELQNTPWTLGFAIISGT